ncbi:unnamed protein product [Linum tenue]|uniref:UspA domain-containing protein n=1 Tax=Linum tenue TaxID=586396 RepID=A0AAV0HB39_9ROSI|nr:unnamed protein product [Linum tenue]
MKTHFFLFYALCVALLLSLGDSAATAKAGKDGVYIVYMGATTPQNGASTRHKAQLLNSVLKLSTDSASPFASIRTNNYIEFNRFLLVITVLAIRVKGLTAPSRYSVHRRLLTAAFIDELILNQSILRFPRSPQRLRRTRNELRRQSWITPWRFVANRRFSFPLHFFRLLTAAFIDELYLKWELEISVPGYCEIASVIGDPKDKICEVVESLNADLLVMGSRDFGAIKSYVKFYADMMQFSNDKFDTLWCCPVKFFGKEKIQDKLGRFDELANASLCFFLLLALFGHQEIPVLLC